MAIMHVPYNQETDPKALFARGFTNFLGGVMQNQQTKRIGDFAGSMDPQATAMQIIASALSQGINPQIALALGGMQQKSTQGLGVLPGWWNLATPQQRQGYLNRVGGTNVNVFGSIPGYLEGDTPEETRENVRRYREKQLKTDAVPLSEPSVQAYGEAMDTRINKVDRFRPGGRDFDEEMLFKEWQKFCGMYKFKNDTQKEQILSVWKNKVNNKGGEVQWDPEDPKWRKAIGLKEQTDKGEEDLSTGRSEGSDRLAASMQDAITGTAGTMMKVGASAAGGHIKGPLKDPKFQFNEQTGKPLMIYDGLGKEIGLRLRNGRIFKIGSLAKRNGITYEYIGNNEWRKQ